MFSKSVPKTEDPIVEVWHDVTENTLTLSAGNRNSQNTLNKNSIDCPFWKKAPECLTSPCYLSTEIAGDEVYLEQERMIQGLSDCRKVRKSLWPGTEVQT